MEIWKDIPGYEGKYQASTFGRIRSYARKKNLGYILKLSNSNGYYVVKLGWGNLQRVPRLVALTFIPNPENKPEINHINGIKNDDRIENLEWCSHRENMIHCVKNGFRSYKNIKRSPALTKEETELIRSLRSDGLTIGSIAEYMDRSVGCIAHLLSGLTYLKYL